MSSSPIKLYTPEVLALATSLARWPQVISLPYQGKARSQTCGSMLAIGLQVDETGRISALGMAAQACAIGQASAAIFGAGASGKSRADLETALGQLEAWLKADGPLPDWPGLAAIAAAQGYTARHGAILLPWKAALDALP